MTAPTTTPMPVEVDAPPLERYPYGLLAAAAVVSVADPRWELHGVDYFAVSCGLTGGIWLDPCIAIPPDPTHVQAFLVTLTKAAAGDVLTATLTARDTNYTGSPVFIGVAGDVKSLSTVGATQTWTVTPSTSVPVIASIGAQGTYPDCGTSITFAVPATDTAGTATLTCTVDIPAPAPTKTIHAGLVEVDGVPFTIYDGLACASLGLSEVGPTAERQFQAREQYWVENAFQTTVLHQGTEVLGGGTAVPLLAGVGELEEVIATRYGGIGTIHAARQLAATLTSKQIVRRDGLRLRSPLDNIYAFGAGYTTDGPTGTPAPAGQAWLYATGPVVIRRGDVELREVFDQRKNTRIAVTERNYVITADCLRVAVLVELPEA